jgi:hypothetical protein
MKKIRRKLMARNALIVALLLKVNRLERALKETSTTAFCVHCGKQFTRNNAIHTYCDESCRIAAWEQRTGKKMLKKKGV